ncbi:hypothetical protein CGJ96_24460, partial [Vibrio parahaemolyticus]
KPTPTAKATASNSNTPAFDKAKATALASVSKPVVKSEPEQELSYEQEKLEHKLKLEAAVRRAKEKRGL